MENMGTNSKNWNGWSLIFWPQDAWLPITDSRNGNAYYSAFHNLNARIGFQALLLPVAFTFLGWSWRLLAGRCILLANVNPAQTLPDFLKRTLSGEQGGASCQP